MNVVINEALHPSSSRGTLPTVSVVAPRKSRDPSAAAVSPAERRSQRRAKRAATEGGEDDDNPPDPEMAI